MDSSIRKASDEIELAERSTGRGLGIDVASGLSPPHHYRIPRTPVGSKVSFIESPGENWPLGSPPSTGKLSGSTRYDNDGLDFPDHGRNHSRQSLLSHNRSYSDLPHKRMTSSMQEQYDENFALQHICSSSRRFKRGMSDGVAIAIVVLSVFSTVFSGIFLGIALRGPRYGRRIGSDGALTVSTAAFMTSIFAKAIELAFVAVVVAYLGQSIARRAFNRESQSGVTLAEMNMRHWVSQPGKSSTSLQRWFEIIVITISIHSGRSWADTLLGTLFVHWKSVRYAGCSGLGIVAVIAAIAALLYTSAATALVQPQLKVRG
jgi:hypothetical protein